MLSRSGRFGLLPASGGDGGSAARCGVMDVTVRGDEDRSTRKSFDTFTPVGPVLVTADEIPDPHDLRLRLWVNGDPRQNGTTRDMIWNIPRLIEYASHVMTLYPGDLFSTGTPDGVGFGRTPPEFLGDGDLMETEIDGIGTMRNRIAAHS